MERLLADFIRPGVIQDSLITALYDMLESF